MDFGRLITAMVTPFDNDLQIDWEQLERLIDYLIEEQKSDALIVSGTTGESGTLTDDEKEGLFRETVRIAAGRCKVIAGTGSNDTAHSVEMTKRAKAVGADGILLVAPYYVRPTQEGIYSHFKAVAEASDLPVMLYNIPGRTGVNVELETVLRIAELPNVVATKEAHEDLNHITQLLLSLPSGFKVYCGEDALTLPYLSIGAHGVVSVASHVIGAKMKEMIETYLAGDIAGAAAMHHKLYPVFKGLFFCPHRVASPAPVKNALIHHGYQVGGLRLPLVPVTESESRFIRELFPELQA
ncbi:4-hydroxy-tetrahydrodipicolinate synthase [Gorillibacterium timonense]|uniref:4-hydroxy-tetrahydrodipicolinate synthase n=1 Tax=Gorillibacterium timonense TaxID=1689269 RepID=UPI00071C8E6C|nr:4-hydroxy-tetrahydrodipicolinate synthase [Gorillibacterium timonense]